MAAGSADINGVLTNRLGKVLKRSAVWKGSPDQFPDEIPAGDERKFNDGSVNGVVYVWAQDNSKYYWVICWSDDKVFTQILFQGEKPVDWGEIEKTLDKSGCGCIVFKGPFESDIFSGDTLLKATIKLAGAN